MDFLEIIFQPKSLLAFVVAVSLVALFFGIIVGLEELKNIALIIFGIFGSIFVVFLLITLARNVRLF